MFRKKKDLEGRIEDLERSLKTLYTVLGISSLSYSDYGNGVLAAKKKADEALKLSSMLREHFNLVIVDEPAKSYLKKG